ncbi:MAG: Ribosomal large subunit pseudouridine synthase D [uncultured Chloroflexia bacterium]|uniref:Pseudouridine synthase n=1 Tax=uncultured Chloroflexia bacterium TaxID=1672391 RepID=A0A6J4I789_9CHLR|nr:MAG: Ribosomal large subunit pseudouridine synthase D [uncultured Chloroflexia bacterium]
MTDVEPQRQEQRVTNEHAGERIDRFLALALPDLSRSYAQQLIDDGHVLVNGKSVKRSTAVQTDDLVTITLPVPQATDLVAEDIPLVVRYEDDDLLVVDKPAGMVVHPAPGHASGTLVNALLYHYPHMEIGGDLRPGIVHRIDRDTSGLLVVAKHDRAKAHLQAQQQARTMTKVYLALIQGSFREPQGTIEAPIDRHPTDRLRMAVVQNGRPSRTDYRELERLGAYSLVEARLHTGRTHQIRVHFAYKHHPVVGDQLYGPRRQTNPLGLGRQFLHAHRLGFERLDGTYIETISPLPPDLQAVLDRLQSQYGYATQPSATDEERPWWEA